MFARICRYYPAYKLSDIGELTWPQACALLDEINARPYLYVVMVDPK